MTNDLEEFVADIHANMVHSNAFHAEAYNDPDLLGYSEITEKHDYTIVIGVDVGRGEEEPSLYEEFVNSLTPAQQLTFHEILELVRSEHDE